MPELFFYTHPMSRGRIVRWMLEEVGVEYRTQVLEYSTTMREKSYLDINPMGKVPAIRHGENIITECAAICAYLADAFPEAGLAPDTQQRADYYRWFFFASGPVEQALTLNQLGVEIDARQRINVGSGTFEDVLAVLEHAVSRYPYIAGDRFTAVDVYLGAHIGWGMQMGSLPDREAFIDYFGRLSVRPAYRRANELDDALVDHS